MGGYTSKNNNLEINYNEISLENDLYKTCIFNYLKEKQLTPCYSENIKFYDFITREEQKDILDRFYKVLYYYNKLKLAISEIDEIYKIYKLSNNIISFKQLFSLDYTWHSFFNNCAYSDGTRKDNEKRRGVNKKWVDDIMKIKKKTKSSLLDSINLYNNITQKKANIQW